MLGGWSVVVAAALALVMAGACGDGEDRPGAATGTGSVTGSVSGTGTGTPTATGPSTGSATGADEHGHEGDEAAAFPAGEADTVVEVREVEYTFILEEGTELRGPKVFFDTTNAGSREHELIVERDGEELAELHLGPGETGELAVELEPGRYTLVCKVQEGDRTHAELGVTTPITVT